VSHRIRTSACIKMAFPTLAAELHFLLLNAVQMQLSLLSVLLACMLCHRPVVAGGFVGLYRVRINNRAMNGDYPAGTDKKMCGHVAHGSSICSRN
jgi:hypothetical protein